MRRLLRSILLAVAAGPLAAVADPMRPLSGAEAAASGVAAAPAASSAASGAQAEPAAPTARVVAIHIDADGTPRALVGERWLRVGDRLDGLRITAIDANTVVLGTARSARRLHLLPPLQYSVPAAAASAPARRRAAPIRRAPAASAPAEATSSTGPRPAARIPQGTTP